MLAELEVEGRPFAELHELGGDAGVVARLDGRSLYLEHRATEVTDVRLADDAGRTHAVGHLDLEDGVADWALPSARHTLRLRASVPARAGAPRPTRRTFGEDAVNHLAYTRYRPKAWVAVLPEDLTPAETLLCLWLVHLLDAHALLGRAWWTAPDGDWTRVPDDFPRRIGPGGFGDPNPTISGAGAAGGGGGS